MRNVFVIAYDVADAKRLRKVFKTMKGVGDALQFSVFCCRLTRVELEVLRQKLHDVLNLKEDRVLVVDLGPSEGRGQECIQQWGKPLNEPPKRGPVIV